MFLEQPDYLKYGEFVVPQLQCNYCKVSNPRVKWRPTYGCYLCTTHANHAGRIKSGKNKDETLKQFLADCIKAEMERQEKRKLLGNVVHAPGEIVKAQLQQLDEETERKRKDAERKRRERALQKNPPPIS
jgi:hypothetical protein